MQTYSHRLMGHISYTKNATRVQTNQVINMYDCIIIGAGHNGLICANYLAKKGWKVLVLEKRHLVGGCTVTEEIAPGYKASICSYVVSLLLPGIVEELELRKHGYKTLPRNPSAFTPFEDGRYLFLGPDQKANYEEIKKFSEKDAKAYGEYGCDKEGVCDVF